MTDRVLEGQFRSLKARAEQTHRLMVLQANTIAALTKRVDELEAKRGPGRPKKDEAA